MCLASNTAENAFLNPQIEGHFCFSSLVFWWVSLISWYFQWQPCASPQTTAQTFALGVSSLCWRKSRGGAGRGGEGEVRTWHSPLLWSRANLKENPCPLSRGLQKTSTNVLQLKSSLAGSSTFTNQDPGRLGDRQVSENEIKRNPNQYFSFKK